MYPKNQMIPFLILVILSVYNFYIFLQANYLFTIMIYSHTNTLLLLSLTIALAVCYFKTIPNIIIAPLTHHF